MIAATTWAGAKARVGIRTSGITAAGITTAGVGKDAQAARTTVVVPVVVVVRTVQYVRYQQYSMIHGSY